MAVSPRGTQALSECSHTLPALELSYRLMLLWARCFCPSSAATTTAHVPFGWPLQPAWPPYLPIHFHHFPSKRQVGVVTSREILPWLPVALLTEPDPWPGVPALPTSFLAHTPCSGCPALFGRPFCPGGPSSVYICLPKSFKSHLTCPLPLFWLF